MKRIMGCLVIAALAGCSQEGPVKEAIKQMLKDPDSAKFERVIVSDKGTTACAIWNAKNGFGGYGKWSASSLSKATGRWLIKDADISVSRCTEHDVNALDRYDAASEGLRRALEK